MPEPVAIRAIEEDGFDKDGFDAKLEAVMLKEFEIDTVDAVVLDSAEMRLDWEVLDVGFELRMLLLEGMTDGDRLIGLLLDGT